MMTRWTVARAAVGLLVIAAAGCRGSEPAKPTGQSGGGEQGTGATMKLTSTAFQNGGQIPTRHAGEYVGDNVSPPLAWSGAPAGTGEFALIVDDPDGRDWVHWVIYRIPGNAASLAEGVPDKATPANPAGAAQGATSYGVDKIGYYGPTPPKGSGVHHYHFKLYALDAEIPAASKITSKQLLEAMKGHILATGELVGTYERK